MRLNWYYSGTRNGEVFYKIAVSLCKHWAEGGKGTEDLAKKVIETCKENKKGLGRIN